MRSVVGFATLVLCCGVANAERIPMGKKWVLPPMLDLRGEKFVLHKVSVRLGPNRTAVINPLYRLAPNPFEIVELPGHIALEAAHGVTLDSEPKFNARTERSINEENHKLLAGREQFQTEAAAMHSLGRKKGLHKTQFGEWLITPNEKGLSLRRKSISVHTILEYDVKDIPTTYADHRSPEMREGQGTRRRETGGRRW